MPARAVSSRAVFGVLVFCELGAVQVILVRFIAFALVTRLAERAADHDGLRCNVGALTSTYTNYLGGSLCKL